MKTDRADRQASTPNANVAHMRATWLLLLCVALWLPASAEEADTAPVVEGAPLSAEQVVHNLVQMNLQRGQALHAYQGTRTYRAEYHGVGGLRNAEMIVSVKYLSPGTKEFIVQSATGSKLIIDKIFKKLLEAEKEAMDAERQRRSAISEDNYHFEMVGYQSTPSGARYVLNVEPRTKDKFLYRGRIWVDAGDFAIVRLEVEPARNPSFWTRKAEVVQVYTKVGDFWLPARNHSMSAIRLGGRAELTIEYDNYEITAAEAVGNTVTVDPIRSAGATRAQALRFQR